MMKADIEVVDYTPGRYKHVIGRSYEIDSAVYENKDYGFVREWLKTLPKDVREMIYWFARVIVQAEDSNT